MEDEDAKRSTGARRQRTDHSRRRPHSQPDRLLSVSCRNPSESATNGKGKEEGSPKEAVRVFKRRETCNRGPAAAAASAEEKPKTTTSKSNALKVNRGKSAPAEQPETKKRRHRLILEGSDDEESESILEKKNNESKESSKKEESCSKTPAKSATEGLALRKSSRVVKRRTFDDEIDYEEVTRRRRKPQDNAEKAPVKQGDSWAEENTDSAEDELPRKKPRRGSILELHAKEKPVAKQRAGSSVEIAAPKEKPLTARQRAMQAKEAIVQEQPSTSGRDEAPKAESPGDDSIESKEKSATPLTARQRSMQACKEGEGNFGLIEFPEGLNCTDRRRKAKLTDEEKLAKKAEAASKRKQQVEKAAKEIQASAIQKILNQDSNRKKKEEKIQKQRQELAEERKAAELEVATKTIRWVMGPSGTTVSWPQDVELPSLFAGPVSYPPPREKCAACDNAYRYRDSKSNLPLCSLQCYKAIQEPKHLDVTPAH